jgi:hypothetical protein
MIFDLAEKLEQTQLGSAIAESRYAFPFIEGVHLIGLSIAVGLLFITDLRLMGLILKKVPVNELLHQLRPWILGGFLGIFISGGLLFFAEASTVLASPAFAFKVAFIVIAGLNAAYFEFVTAKHPAIPENQSLLPRGVKYAGAASLALWSLVIICGRLIPYVTSW